MAPPTPLFRQPLAFYTERRKTKRVAMAILGLVLDERGEDVESQIRRQD
jgi:hypothetical protein